MNMNKRELKKKLKDSDISKHLYCFNDGYFPGECYCLNKVKDFWEVYYSERGKKIELKLFNNEEEACEYFYKILKEDQERSLL